MKPQLRWYVHALIFYASHGERDSLALIGVVPAMLLIQLPNLRQWIIKVKSRQQSICCDEEPLWMSFNRLSLASLGAYSQNIETLELHGVSFSTCSDFLLYVAAFPQIRTLKCTGVQIKDTVLMNGTLVDWLSKRLKLQNIHAGELTERAVVELLINLAQGTLENLCSDLDTWTVGPMPSYPASFPLYTRLLSLTVTVPDVCPDPHRAWAQLDGINESVSCLPSGLRRITVKMSPKHLQELIERRSEPFKGVQMFALAQSNQSLRVSVSGERANRVDVLSAALKGLFSTLEDHGLLELEFPSQRITGHTRIVWVMTISADSRWLATASEDKTIILWDVQANGTLREWEADIPITFLAFSAHSDRLVFPHCFSGSFDTAVWGVQDGGLLGSLSGHSAPVATCVWSPDDTKLASTAPDGLDTIRVWDAKTYGQLYVLRDAFRIPACAHVRFSPNGRWLHVACPHLKMTVCRVWHADTGEPYRVISHKHLVTTVTFDSTSKLLASASEEGTVFLWRMKTMEWMQVALSEPLAQAQPCSRLATIAFSQDGVQVLVAWAVLSTITVQVWDPVAGDRLMSLEGHHASVLSLCVSRGATYVASGSSDKTVRLWRVHDGSCVATFAEHDAKVGHVGFSPDGETLCSGAEDGSVVIRRLRHLIARRNA